MVLETNYSLNTIVYLINDNKLRSSKILRIVTDSGGTNYIMNVDGIPVERSGKEIDKSPEGLLNKLLTIHQASKIRR